jgi:ribosomal protein S18 acetylase RimI-like enzyme
MTISSRSAAGLDDLQAARDLQTRAWIDGAPFVTITPGDLNWWYAQAWPSDLSERLRLWTSDDRIVGWSWEDGSGLESGAWSGDAGLDVAVQRAILVGAIDRATARARVGGDGTVEAWAADDDAEAVDRLHGFRFERAPSLAQRHSATSSQFQRTVEDPDAIPDRPLPNGYRIRSVAGLVDYEARVAVHRAAFAPSRMNVGKYERLSELPAYRSEDDLVVEAPDGSFAAFAMAWWDPIAQVGEFEPVGTHPDHQRRGLGAALLGHGLRRYASFGARLVQVFSDAENVASEALYQSVGFRRRAYHRLHRRPSD